MSNLIDMTGWKMWEHGVSNSKWTVLYKAQRKNNKIMWHCQCECGREKDVRATHLRDGTSLSCGCISKNLGEKSIQPGDVFGLLTVIERNHDITKRKNDRCIYYKCKCDCNKHSIVNVSSKYLRHNPNPNCGCLNNKSNNFELNLQDEYGLYGIGYCTNTNNKFYFDMDDYEKISNYNWREHVHNITEYHCVVANSGEDKKDIKMQWIVAGKYYDHRDRNPLNNRKYNLRPSTICENNQNRSKGSNNTSGIIGVYWNKKAGKWCAYIMYDNQRLHLGSFVDKNSAVKARLIAEMQYHGEFAPQRHLYEQYGIKTIQN